MDKIFWLSGGNPIEKNITAGQELEMVLKEDDLVEFVSQ